MKRGVVVFGKEARPGKVKTRLAQDMGNQHAVLFYRAFAQDIFEMVGCLLQREEQTDGFLAWSGSREAELVSYATEVGLQVIDQGSGGLGDRLERVCSEMRARGYEEILIIGTDSPTLSEEHLQTAFLSLEFHHVVFGPSFDGGYYLIGMALRRAEPTEMEELLFREIEWSTSKVLGASLRAAKKGGLLCDLLGFWYDIDTVEDLEILRYHLPFLAAADLQVGGRTREVLEKIEKLQKK